MRSIRFSISCLMLILSLHLSAQTKEETQAWIAERLEILAYSNDAEGFKHENTVTYSEGNMIIKTSYISDISNSDPLVIIYTIPIKEINTIVFDEKTNTIWLTISIKGNSNLIKKHVEWNSEESSTNTVELILSKSVKEDEQKNRLTKAFNHLKKLNGGTVVSDKF